jgi:formamidopyrimidine-DNA glycosylase
VIEHPEALTFARQLNETIRGKAISSAVRGNTPHKFAFYTLSADEYASVLAGRAIGESVATGSLIHVACEPGYVLAFGDGGERILYHPDAASFPKKHQLLLQFADGSGLSVSVQGWGSVRLLKRSEIDDGHAFAGHAGPGRVAPLDAGFTPEYFVGLFDGLREGDPRSVKYFVISEPGVWGVGNGCLQDVLFRAGLHPRRRAVSLNEAERRALHGALREVVGEATALGGRSSERDLFNRPGGPVRAVARQSRRRRISAARCTGARGANRWRSRGGREPRHPDRHGLEDRDGLPV